jgi:hypothetical protein
MEVQQGAIRIFLDFFGRDADRWMMYGALGSKPSARPAARSVESSAHTAIRVSRMPAGRGSSSPIRVSRNGQRSGELPLFLCFLCFLRVRPCC